MTPLNSDVCTAFVKARARPPYRSSMYAWLRRIAHACEDSRVPFPMFAGVFLFWVTLRNVYEMIVDDEPLTLGIFAHFTVFYIAMALGLSLALAPFRGRKPHQVLRLVMPWFVVTALPPTLDATVFAHLEPSYAYFNAQNWQHFVRAYFTWFGSYEQSGVTPGIQVELAVVVLVALLYIHAHTGSLLRALAASVVTWSVLFFYGSLHTYFTWFEQLTGVPAPFDLASIMRLFGLLIVAETLALVALADTTRFAHAVRQLPWLTIVHFALLFALGLALGPPLERTASVPLAIASVAASVVLAVACQAVIERDLDRSGEPSSDRPGAPEAKHATVRAAFWLSGAALGLSLCAGFAPTACVFLAAASYFVYAAPPLRLKDHLLGAPVLFGIGGGACVLAGFTLFEPRVYQVPTFALLAVVGVFSLTAFFAELRGGKALRVAGATATLALYLSCAYAAGANWLGVFLAFAAVAQVVLLWEGQPRGRLAVQNLALLAVLAFTW